MSAWLLKVCHSALVMVTQHMMSWPHLAPLLVYDGHPGVPCHPLSVGRQDLGSNLFFGVPFPHQGIVLLILDHAGQQRVITQHLDQGSRQAVAQTWL